MKKLTTIAIAVTAALSLNANAGSHDHFHGHSGITHAKTSAVAKITPRDNVSKTPQKMIFAKSYARSASVSAKTASNDQIVPSECTPAEFASYSGNDFVEYVSNAYLQNSVSAGYECFRSIAVNFDEDTIVFSEDNINNVADAIVSELSGDDTIPERIFGKLMYLRVMYYNYMQQNGAHSVPTDESKIKAAFDAILANYDGSVITETHQITIAELIIALGSYYSHLDFKEIPNDGSRKAEWADTVVGPMKQYLTAIQDKFESVSIDDDEELYRAQYGMTRVATEITYEFERMTRYYVGQDTYTDTEMPGILAKYAYDVEVDDPVPSNAVYALLGMVEQGATDSTIAAVQEILDNTGKFSQPHIALLNTINNSDVECDIFDRDDLLCVGDELLAEMHEFALPNEFQFGDITFITKMSEERTRHIYNSLQATRSRFFRETGITEAVENDPNENATFVLYGSPEDYKTFQGYLYGYDSNNGGIYIEQDGTLFSFDRPDTEMFVLEELARHEYVHYLNGRYLTQGMWWETDFFEGERYTWFDEGFANYLTGATQASDPVPLKNMIEMKSWYDNKSVSEIINATYEDEWMYPYTALLFNYLNSVGSDAIVDLAAAIRSDDGAEFDAVEQTLIDVNAGFQTYIDGLSIDTWEAPWFAYKQGAALEADGIDDIQTTLTDSMGYAAGCSEADEENFTCSFSIEAAGIKATQIEIVNSVLDTGITLALVQGENNFETVTCHPTTFNGETVDAECIGLLRPDDVDYDDGSDEPVDSDGDGYPDDQDAFPNDPTEWEDTDGDGVGNNGDAFPNDATEWADTDGDGTGDNSDVFPNDPTEWEDSDGDGYGNNGDAFPADPTEWLDSDGDGTGDNSDAFPNDSTEWVDTDGDGYGDNSDAYPNDASKWQQETSTGGNNNTATPEASSSSSSGGSFGIWSIFGALGLLWARRKGIDIA